MSIRFNVHIYREMRLRFDGIEADSPEQAAEKARDMHFDDAQDWSDCEGDTLAALVDVVGDEDYSKSIVIDFEPGRMLKAAPRLIEALERAEFLMRRVAKGDHQALANLADAARQARAAITLARGRAA